MSEFVPNATLQVGEWGIPVQIEGDLFTRTLPGKPAEPPTPLVPIEAILAEVFQPALLRRWLADQPRSARRERPGGWLGAYLCEAVPADRTDEACMAAADLARRSDPDMPGLRWLDLYMGCFRGTMSALSCGIFLEVILERCR